MQSFRRFAAMAGVAAAALLMCGCLEQTVLIKVKKDGRTSEIVIEYKMRRAKGRWVVYDVITDDVSIVRNYRSQFNRIIRRDSYEVLVKKMRRKLEKL